MLAATWLSVCNTLATVPSLAAMKIAQNEANALGQAWATYIESFPSAKRKATLQMVQRIVPGMVAFGTTALIFAPRIQVTQAQMRARSQQSQERQPRRTPPPPVFRRFEAEQQQRAPTQRDVQARNDIIDGMDGGDMSGV